MNSKGTQTPTVVQHGMNCMTLEVTDYYELDWVLIPGRQSVFHICHHIQTVSGTTSAPCTVSTSGIEGPMHEADHSHPSTSEIKNLWSYSSTFLTYLLGLVFIQRSNFEFTCCSIWIITACRLRDGHKRLEQHTAFIYHEDGSSMVIRSIGTLLRNSPES
jgi:hypothetical protein